MGEVTWGAAAYYACDLLRIATDPRLLPERIPLLFSLLAPFFLLHVGGTLPSVGLQKTTRASRAPAGMGPSLSTRASRPPSSKPTGPSSRATSSWRTLTRSPCDGWRETMSSLAMADGKVVKPTMTTKAGSLVQVQQIRMLKTSLQAVGFPSAADLLIAGAAYSSWTEDKSALRVAGTVDVVAIATRWTTGVSTEKRG